MTHRCWTTLTTDMLSSLIKGVMHTYTFISSLFTMNGPDQDIFAALMSSQVHNDITSFVSAHHKYAQLSSQPTVALQYRFNVIMIGVNKAKLPAQHESLVLWVRDNTTLVNHEFVIERVPSNHAYSSRFTSFSQSSESQLVLDTIKKSTKNIAALAASISCTDDENETIPLLSPHESAPPAPDPLSLIDQITSSLVKAVAMARPSSQSLSPQQYAHDSISGRIPGTLKADECISVFRPVGLSLFDAALLAQVVHENAPLYGLFDNHCYMFASVIFESIIQLYSLPGVLDPPTSASQVPPGGVPAPSREVGGEPQNANLISLPCPDAHQSGRWSGLLVLDPLVRETIVCVVIEQFKPLRTHYLQPFFNK
jgi:hypothetical protein